VPFPQLLSNFLRPGSSGKNTPRDNGATTRLGAASKRLFGHAPFGHWNTMTFIAALRVDRVSAPWVIDGPINATTFLVYVEKVLAPELKPGDYNNFRPHSSLGYQTPADHAGTIAATGSNATQCGSFAFPPVAPTAPFGVSK
jgi:transposase InsO family protein